MQRGRDLRFGLLPVALAALQLGCGADSSRSGSTGSTGGASGAVGGSSTGGSGPAVNIGGSSAALASGGALSSAGGATPTGSGGATSPGGATLYGACAAYMDAQCNRRRYECVGAAPVANPCPEYRSWCPDFFLSSGSNATVSEIEACTEQWRTHPCDRIRAHDEPQCAFSLGDFALGESCLYDRQCQSLKCRGQSDCKQCVPVGQVGDTCSGDVACPSGTECFGTCEVPPPFDLALPGEVCSDATKCGRGYACVTDATDGQDRCVTQSLEGQSCSTNQQCEAWTLCDPATNVCTPFPAAGESCEEQTICRRNAICDTASKLCVPRGAIGTACTPVTQRIAPSANCELDLVCACSDATCSTGTCLKPLDEGAACGVPTSRCVDGTECTAGICTGVDLQGLFDAACSASP